MRIDATHRPWAMASTAILLMAMAAYVPYAAESDPVGGGTYPGLAYGTVGFAFMAFVTLLAVRKKFPIWRVGRTTTWMRGHLWLGALSFPLILLHAGFLWGHGLTSVMMWLFALVYVSGFFGAWMQHAIPRRLMRDVPMETIYDEIGHVREQLLDEADGIVAAACGKLEVEVSVSAAAASSGTTALATVMRTGSGDADDGAPLRDFYMKEMRPFVQAPSVSHPLASAMTAAAMFGKLRPLVPATMEPAIADLENICEEERQLLRQRRMHGVLHAWLIIHVPLSFALMVLAVVHIVMALKY
jgi:hypothetical protein